MARQRATLPHLPRKEGSRAQGPAIQRERSLKEWRRQWKINLIERDNPRWDDLYSAVFEWTPVPRLV
jgi:predicted GIY-YIG superfamily endonuclease